VTFETNTNITTLWNNNAFSSDSSDSNNSGTSLWSVYSNETKAGTYTRNSNGTTWTQTQPSE
jgi:hypothetical protein